MSTVHERLKAARRAREGMTLQRLAGLCEVSITALASWERGSVVPSIEHTRRLADALGVTPAWLAYGAGPGLERAEP